MSTSTDLERKSLEAHVDLCQQRYQELERRLSRVEWRLDKIEDTLQEIKSSLNHGHKEQIQQLLAAATAIIAVLLGVVGYLFSLGLH